jgi:glycosyltransferase involved in cell wall biosynthesis
MTSRILSKAGCPLGLLVKIWPKLSETFILEEVLTLQRHGVALRLYALAEPTDALTHSAVARVRAPLTYVPQSLRGHWAEFAARHLRVAGAAPLAYLRALVFAVRRGRRALQDFLQAGWLAAQSRDDGIGHLHTHFISTPADVAELVSRLTTLPFSISAHAKDIYLSDPADLRRKLEAARFTVTCTEFNRRTLASIAPRARVHRMYHGVDQTQFHPRQRAGISAPAVILSVGRLREKKGLDTLIDACRVLRARGQAFRCEIVGYGEEHDRLQARIARHGLTDEVCLVGKLPREQVIECYARAAVYVQPSRIAADGDRDGIPNVLLEAMAMGLPVVASSVSGIPELVRDGRNGLLVEPDDPVALADAITRLLHQPRLCAELTCHARETVAESFDNDRNLRLLRRLLHEHRVSSAEPLPADSPTSDDRARHAPLGAK